MGGTPGDIDNDTALRSAMPISSGRPSFSESDAIFRTTVSIIIA
jgi:hypothetical protein